MEVNNAVTIVTGASAGIGEATARLLAKNGARLVLAARSADKLAKLADEIGAPGREVLAVPTDMARPDAVRALFDAAMRRFGRLDLLINDAGISTCRPLEKMIDTEFQTMFDLNVLGTLHAMQAGAALMRAHGGGLIVNISSMVSRQTWPGMGAYAATKHALNCLSETLRVEVAKDNIRVSVVFPGNTATDFGRNALSMVDPPTEVPGGGEWVVDTPEFVAEKILLAIRTEPHEQYMR